MLSRVLVPHDGSATSASIFAHVRRLIAGDPKGQAIVLRVVEDGPNIDERRQAAAADLNEVIKALKAEGLACTLRVVDGDPADGILSAAKDLEPDLIAMSTHGRSGLTRLLRGSVAERVLRHALQPVLLCNPNTIDLPAFGRVLVALDGSERSMRALPLVEALAKKENATVVLFTVQPALYSDVPRTRDAEQVWTEDHLTEALSRITPAQDRLHELGIQAECEASHGVPAHEILEAAERADLVVMTTHGFTGASRWWFGSVAESVARSCTRPLLVIRTQSPGD